MFLFQTIGTSVIKVESKPTERKDVLKIDDIINLPKDACWKLKAIETSGNEFNARLPQHNTKLKEDLLTAVSKRKWDLSCPVEKSPEPTAPPQEPRAVWYNPMSWTLKALYRASQTGR